MVAVGGIASFVLSDDRVEVWGFFSAFSIWHWCSSTREGVYDVPKFGQCRRCFLHVMYATALIWQVLCHIMGLGWESKVS